MNQQLELVFNLNKTQYFWGESIPFLFELSNVSSMSVNVLSLEPSNQSIIFILRNQKGKKRVINQTSTLEQDEIHTQPPRKQEGAVLLSGKSLKLKGDLLALFGYLSQGKYTLTVEYRGILTALKTESLVFQIIPTRIIQSSVPKWGFQNEKVPFTGIFEHQEKEKYCVFYQKLSPYFPKNPQLGIVVDLSKIAKRIQVACLANKNSPMGHLYYWKNEKFLVNTVDFKKFLANQPKEIKEVKTKSEVLKSGISTKRGVLLLPIIKENNFLLLEISNSGKVIEWNTELNIDHAIDKYRCYWEGDTKLHFVWSEKDKKQIYYSQLSLATFKASPKKIIYTIADPIIWLDTYRDNQLKTEELRALYLGEDNAYVPSNPKIIFWVISQKKNSLVCTTVNSITDSIIRSVAFKTEGINNLKIISSVVMTNHELAFLVKDDKEALYYVSTVKKKIISLDKFKKEPPRINQNPVLISSGKGAIEVRVYLRYIKNKAKIEHLLLETAL